MQSEKRTLVTVILITTFFISLLIVIVVRIIILYQRRHLLYKRGLEILKADFDQNLIRSQLEIQEQTLLNTSREIHDNIGLALTLAKLQLNTIGWENIMIAQEQVDRSVNFIS